MTRALVLEFIKSSKIITTVSAIVFSKKGNKLSYTFVVNFYHLSRKSSKRQPKERKKKTQKTNQMI